MIGKVSVGKDFGGCIRYLFGEGKEAEILGAEGVNCLSPQTLISDFDFQRELRPELGNAVCLSLIHI